MDQHEYTLDDDDRMVQDVIMKPDPSNTDAVVLRRSLSFSYPDLPFNEVIKKENEKLHLELQHSQSYLDVGQCEMIQHLMEISQFFASDYQFEKDVPYYPYVNENKEQEYNKNLPTNAHSTLRLVSHVHFKLM